MYTANSMFTIFEAMGLSPLYASSKLADEKIAGDIGNIGGLMQDIVLSHRTPSTYITKASFENAVRILCVL